MCILAIESSCDETAVALVESPLSKEGELLSNLPSIPNCLAHTLSSQINWHKQYGGVVPEQASRMHTETIHHLIDQVLSKAQLSFSDLTAVAVTYGPGLEGALLVGTTVAMTLSRCLDIPYIPVNHLHGHIYACMIGEDSPKFPFMVLLVSGGHTQLVLAKDHFNFQIVGQTRDDACGEAFDKVARVCGLPYPGGPEIEKQAREGDPHAFVFPQPMRGKGLDFSFSGLKTAVAQQVASLPKDGDLPVSDIAASFQLAVGKTLAEKSILACQETETQQLVLSGGVAANSYLREYLSTALSEAGISLVLAPKAFCTDNAVMIGLAAYYQLQQFPIPTVSRPMVRPNLSVEDLL